MLGLDFSELIIIGVVALVVVGPKELPQLLRTVGQWVAKARRMASEFQGQMNEAIREAELDDVRKSVDDLRSLSPKALVAEHLTSVTRTLDEVKRETEAVTASIGSQLNDLPAPAVAASAEVATAAELPAAPVVAEGDAVRAIDAAAAGPIEIAPPIFDLTPAPGGPVAVAEAEPAAEPMPAEPKKEHSA
jgi:sec-independent protein translocase protein TatB